MRTWVLTKDAEGDRWWISPDGRVPNNYPVVLAETQEQAQFFVEALNEKEQRAVETMVVAKGKDAFRYDEVIGGFVPLGVPVGPPPEQQERVAIVPKSPDAYAYDEGEDMYAEFVMPLPICPTCGTALNLDRDTYSNFEGQITCYECKGRMSVYISGGSLRYCHSAVDRDLTLPANCDTSKRHWVAYDDALACLAIGAFKACATMGRLSLCHALITRGIEDAETETMINKAISNGWIAGKYKHLAKAVGWFGGKAGHPQDDPIFDVGQPEATQGMRILRELLVMLEAPPKWEPTTINDSEGWTR